MPTGSRPNILNQDSSPPTTSKKRGADETLVSDRLRELFPGAAAKAAAKSRGERDVEGSFKMLSHDLITVRPQVRRTFAKVEMDELRASIRAIRAQNGGIEGTGVLQALLVSPLHNPDGALSGYRLIAGEKRFRSTRDEGLAEVPCIVVAEASESLIRLMQLTENALRTPPPVLEEALAMRDTVTEMELSLRDMARMMGKSLGYVTERLGLLKMGEDVQGMVFARANTLRHARLIDPIEDLKLRSELIAAALDGTGEREIRRRIDAQTVVPPFDQVTGNDAGSKQLPLQVFPTREGENKGESNGMGKEGWASEDEGQSYESSAEDCERQFINENPDSYSDAAHVTFPHHNSKSSLAGNSPIGSSPDRSDRGSIAHNSQVVDSAALSQTLRPLSDFLTEATRHLQTLSLSAQDKQQIRLTLAAVREQLLQLEELAK